jgi:outer membrane receptor protein involved in Fe transport
LNTNETFDYDSRDKIHSTDRAIGLNWEHNLSSGWTLQNNLRYSDKQALWNTTAVVYPFAVDGIVWHALNGTIAKFGTYNIREHGTGKDLMTVGQFPNIVNGQFAGFAFPVLNGSLPGSSVQANSLFFNPLFYQNNHLKETLDQLTLTKKLKNMSFTVGGLLGLSNIQADQSTGTVSYGTITAPHPTTVDITYTDPGGKTYQLTNPDGVIGGSGASTPYTARNGKQNQIALFFGHNWEINSKLNLDWGLRYENFSVKGDNTPSVAGVDTTGGTDKNLLTLYDNGLNLPGTTYNYDKSFNTLSYSAGLNYRITDNLAIYGRYSRGAKAPDMDIFLGIDSRAEADLLQFEAQKTQQFELGLKGRSGKSSYFLTPFYSHLTNVFTQTLGLETADLGSAYTAAPLFNEYKTLGVELEANVHLVRNFDVRGVFTVQKSEASKFQTWILGANGKADDKIQDFSGNKTDNAANLFFSITPTYSANRFYASLNFYYMGKRAANVPNAFELPAYNQSNLTLGYDITKAFRLSLNINNLFNQNGVMGWSAPGGFPAALDRQGFTKELLAANPNAVYSTLSNPPRAYFLTASYKF